MSILLSLADLSYLGEKFIFVDCLLTIDIQAFKPPQAKSRQEINQAWAWMPRTEGIYWKLDGGRT